MSQPGWLYAIVTRPILFACGICAILFATTFLVAQSEKALHSFENNGTDAGGVDSALTFGRSGNLYGTSAAGGSYNVGSVFELVQTVSGEWSEKILHSFHGTLGGQGNDGQNPEGGLALDGSGNLYGTTFFGGTELFGTVFELIHETAGVWQEKILYDLQTGPSGQCPGTGVIFDKAGNLYGTAKDEGCGSGDGVVFELSPESGGGWAKKTLHQFSGGPTDGKYPSGQLVLDEAHNLYGPTELGGNGVNCEGLRSCGTIFELTRGADGSWNESVLHNFSNDGTDGYYPFGSLTLDASGNLYGTAAGGTHNNGAVFELSFSSGIWVEKILYSFGTGTDGNSPNGGLVFDGAGNLYGITYEGGTTNQGTIFELSPSGGAWVEKIVHSFDSADAIGYYPSNPLTIDASGNLYGATTKGGAYGLGTIFEFTP